MSMTIRSSSLMLEGKDNASVGISSWKESSSTSVNGEPGVMYAPCEGEEELDDGVREDGAKSSWFMRDKGK